MSIDAMFDALGVPSSWRFPLLTLTAMIALATLDFLGAIFAKEWSTRGHPLLVLGGLVSFTVLFFIYARTLQVAELSIVTIGWVVFLQVGLLVVDRFVYGVSFGWDKWVAIVLIIVLQAYLVLGPTSGSRF
jgi:hypothetical protein